MQKKKSRIIWYTTYPRILSKENSIYVEGVIHLRYCGLEEERTCGLRITKEIGEIQLAHAVVISILTETLMSYSHGNGYI